MQKSHASDAVEVKPKWIAENQKTTIKAVDHKKGQHKQRKAMKASIGKQGKYRTTRNDGKQSTKSRAKMAKIISGTRQKQHKKQVNDEAKKEHTNKTKTKRYLLNHSGS